MKDPFFLLQTMFDTYITIQISDWPHLGSFMLTNSICFECFLGVFFWGGDVPSVG